MTFSYEIHPLFGWGRRILNGNWSDGRKIFWSSKFQLDSLSANAQLCEISQKIVTLFHNFIKKSSHIETDFVIYLWAATWKLLVFHVSFVLSLILRMLSLHCLLYFFCELNILTWYCDHKRDKTETKQFASACSSNWIWCVWPFVLCFMFCFGLFAFSFFLPGVYVFKLN